MMQDDSRDNKGRFKPGTSGNPAGSRPKEPYVKQARMLTKARYEEIVHRMSGKTLAELQQCMKDVNNTDALEGMVCSVIYHCIKKGDIARLEAFLCRLIGPVPKHVKVDAANFAELFANAIEEEKATREGNGAGDTEST